jgi:hypothetical protein
LELTKTSALSKLKNARQSKLQAIEPTLDSNKNQRAGTSRYRRMLAILTLIRDTGCTARRYRLCTRPCGLRGPAQCICFVLQQEWSTCSVHLGTLVSAMFCVAELIIGLRPVLPVPCLHTSHATPQICHLLLNNCSAIPWTSQAGASDRIPLSKCLACAAVQSLRLISVPSSKINYVSRRLCGHALA